MYKVGSKTIDKSIMRECPNQNICNYCATKKCLATIKKRIHVGGNSINVIIEYDISKIEKTFRIYNPDETHPTLTPSVYGVSDKQNWHLIKLAKFEINNS